MLKFILCTLVFISFIEANDIICKDESENFYSKEELSAYFIREHKIKPLKIKCNKNEKYSCILQAMENIYNFHPCETESLELRKQGFNTLKSLCSENHSLACFTLGSMFDVSYTVDQDYYLFEACKQDKTYCTPKNHKIEMIEDKENELQINQLSSLAKHTEVESYINFLRQKCEEGNSEVCFQLMQLYTNHVTINGEVNEWVTYDTNMAIKYRYQTCISSYEKLGCFSDYETDFQPPKKWLVDRAKNLNIQIPPLAFLEIKKDRKKVLNQHITKCSRSRVVRYLDKSKQQEWQINENSKSGLKSLDCNEDMGYFKGTTLNICKRLIPKDFHNWRLPFKKELINKSKLFNAKIDFQYYWTSEQSKEDPMDYWVVDVRNRTTHQVYKNNHYNKGCVYIRDF